MSSVTTTIDKRMNIIALTWPLFIEIFLRTALNACDVFMLSSYSDQAVSAVGVVGQLTFFLIIISAMVSSGAGILIAQYNGSSRSRDSAYVAVASLFLSAIAGFLLSIIAVLVAKYFLPLYGLDTQVEHYAQTYLLISGSMTFNLTLGVILTTILRSHGYSKPPMIINLISGVINAGGNYIVLYQPFGLPIYGVQGVAIATVTSQIFSTLCLFIIIQRTDIKLPFRELKKIPKDIYSKIINIGVINAGEGLSFNTAQICITFFIVQMGTASLTAFVYAQNIVSLSFSFALALGQGSQIQAGYYIGRGWIDSTLALVKKYFCVGIVISTSLSIMIYVVRDIVISVFTTDPEIIALTAGLIACTVFMEPGRVFNLIFVSTLKAAGDIKYPVKIGILSMWGLRVGAGFLFGLHWGYGVYGVWMAMALDEWVRGIIMARRWNSKVWIHYTFDKE